MIPLRGENTAAALVTGPRASLLLITTTEQTHELLISDTAELSTIKKRTVAIDTQAHEQLRRHRRVWEQKAILRRVYKEEFFARLLASRRPGGLSVEVG